jgi:hypothetical protein
LLPCFADQRRKFNVIGATKKSSPHTWRASFWHGLASRSELILAHACPATTPPKEAAHLAIDRLHGARADYLGTVIALDAETAIEQACKKFAITDPKYREQLVAREL